MDKLEISIQLQPKKLPFLISANSMTNKSSHSKAFAESCDQRLNKLESNHIAQEHRVVHLILNVVRNWKTEGEKRDVSIKALSYRILFLVLAGGSVVSIGLFGVWLAWQSNQLLKEQNVLAEAQRRSALVFELSAIMDQVTEEVRTWHGMANSAKVLYLETIGLSRKIACSSDRDEYCRSGVPLSQATLGRVAALSAALRPYRYVDPNSGLLTEKATSPERGQLLIALINAGVYLQPIFNKTSFRGADISDSYIENVDLTGIDLSLTMARRTVFRNVKFLEMSYGYGADFRGAVFCDVTIGQFVLKGSEFGGSIFVRGNIDGLLYRDAKMANLIGTQFVNAKIGKRERETKPNPEIFERLKVLPKETPQQANSRFWNISNEKMSDETEQRCRGRPVTSSFGAGGSSGFSGGGSW